MKSKTKILTLGLCAGLLALSSCSDFEDINVDPTKAEGESLRAEWALNKAISDAQMNPDIAERIVVYNWGSAARICGEMTFLNLGRYNDSYMTGSYYPAICAWIRAATLAISVVDDEEGLWTPQQVKFYPNLKQYARIWRAYLISEFTDTLGPYALDSFHGINPEFNSEEEVYDFLLTELSEAVNAIDVSIAPDASQASCDPAYGYDATKWKKYGISMWMRIAMRLSNVDPAKAQSNFEAAVAAGEGVTAADDIFQVVENTGWNEFSGVYTRTWDDQVLSSTMANIMTNLGGVSVASQRVDLEQYVKDKNYLGLYLPNHFVAETDNPTKQYFLDGLPENLDPRALEIFCLPDDAAALNYIDKYTNVDAKSFGLLDPNDPTKKLFDIDATCCWNGYPVGTGSTWSPVISLNELVNESGGAASTMPILGNDYCAGTGYRVFFGPWETYFLLAEASLYGWNTGTTAEEAYENGVRASFEYFGVSQYVDTYLNSEEYNRVGTSVKFTHTTEPTATQMTYVDGYTGQEGTVTYNYPDASKILYSGHKLNDQLTKIITQKYIAQTPYVALEMWNDHRRLGLPFFDTPANQNELTGTDMQNTWMPKNYANGQTIGAYPQRMRYPTSLNTADPVGYQHAVELLGGPDNIMTPLWWAKH